MQSLCMSVVYMFFVLFCFKPIFNPLQLVAQAFRCIAKYVTIKFDSESESV